MADGDARGGASGSRNGSRATPYGDRPFARSRRRSPRRDVDDEPLSADDDVYAPPNRDVVRASLREALRNARPQEDGRDLGSVSGEDQSNRTSSSSPHYYSPGRRGHSADEFDFDSDDLERDDSEDMEDGSDNRSDSSSRAYRLMDEMDDFSDPGDDFGPGFFDELLGVEFLGERRDGPAGGDRAARNAAMRGSRGPSPPNPWRNNNAVVVDLTAEPSSPPMRPASPRARHWRRDERRDQHRAFDRSHRPGQRSESGSGAVPAAAPVIDLTGDDSDDGAAPLSSRNNTAGSRGARGFFGWDHRQEPRPARDLSARFEHRPRPPALAPAPARNHSHGTALPALGRRPFHWGMFGGSRSAAGSSVSANNSNEDLSAHHRPQMSRRGQPEASSRPRQGSVNINIPINAAERYDFNLDFQVNRLDQANDGGADDDPDVQVLAVHRLPPQAGHNASLHNNRHSGFSFRAQFGRMDHMRPNDGSAGGLNNNPVDPLADNPVGHLNYDQPAFDAVGFGDLLPQLPENLIGNLIRLEAMFPVHGHAAQAPPRHRGNAMGNRNAGPMPAGGGGAPGHYKPPHIPPPPPREGFTRCTGKDVVVVCPSCDEELCYDPDAEVEEEARKKEEAKSKGAASASSSTPRRKGAAGHQDHHFWAVKACGHVFCRRCYENRRPTGKDNQQTHFREGPGHTRSKPKVLCSVEGCPSDVTRTDAWVGLYA